MKTVKYDNLLFAEECKIKNIIGVDVDIQKYYERFGDTPAAVEEYVRLDENFVGFAFLSLHEYEKVNDMNIGVRADPDFHDYPKMKHQMSGGGYDLSYFPGKVNICNGKPIDGRGRIKALIEIMKKRGIPEKDWYIPVAVVRLEEHQEISTGVRDNTRYTDHDPLKMEDCVTSALAQHARGHLENNSTKIYNWLISECAIDTVFARQTITKIVNDCTKRLDKNNKAVYIQSREEWKDWLDDSDVALIKVKGNAAEQFFNRYILNYMAKTSPIVTKVVLYTGAKTDAQAREQMKKFVENLKKYYRNAFKMVNNVLKMEQDIEVRDKMLDPIDREKKGYDTFGYELVGIIPQIDNEFQRDLLESKKDTTGSRGIDHLVSYDDYMNKH